MRVSVWFLYVSVCGLLCLFLLLKNASTLKLRDSSSSSNSQDSGDGGSKNSADYLSQVGSSYVPLVSKQTLDPEYNMLTDKGQLILMYFGGILILTLIFFASLR